PYPAVFLLLHCHTPLTSQTLEQTKQIGQFAVLLRKDFSNSPSPPILSCVACYRGVAMQQ
ncbi:hypothetical protein, partial [Phascolarctobacterium succinatutens]|uniref:hypothetical protein n=1 Tax=Phascolarctobacterium succinatutens TaxID=626940 RepID=UPI003079D595